MKIGIPRAMLYYKYSVLWEHFFRALNCEVILSGETTAKTMENGLRFSIDECCIPSKIYMGHVFELINKCDKILVPRIERFTKQEETCVKLWALPDIVSNTFPEANLICYNIDAKSGLTEEDGFVAVGKSLKKGRAESLAAYEAARAAQLRFDAENARRQQEILDDESAFKLLLVTHPYNIHDPLLGRTIVKAIEQLGGKVVFADMLDKTACYERSTDISQHLYWRYSRELVGAISLCRGQVDGILLITAFPCGPDSLVNELLLRRIKHTPTAHIVLDEQSGTSGLVTRIESFMDIISARAKERA